MPPLTSTLPSRVLPVNYIFSYDWYSGWPADYPLITEVDAGRGYIELSTAGDRELDLSGWRIVSAGSEVQLPAATRLQPSRPLILARDASAFAQEFGPNPSLVELPGLRLSTEKDRVELRSGPELVDRVAWGGGMPGWTLSGRRTLCRNPAFQDTSTYLDWSLPSAPSPGAPGCGR